MTDNEIVKALECCGKGFGNCDGCPYDDDNADCVTLKGETLMMKDALDLINRQKAEIERLEAENNKLKVASNLFAMYVQNVEEVKADARKEFAERLKPPKNELQIIGVSKIDKVLEEYLQQNKKE